MSVQLFAPAKINLSLRVGGPLPDGRHPLDSLVAFTRRVGDTLTIEPSDQLSLSIEGLFGDGLTHEADNLVLRAATQLQAFAKVSHGAHMTLVKNLPLASGIGGGSADAAAALIGLNQLWELGLSTSILQSIGAKLGADVPACIAGTPLRMTGTGEEITALSKVACVGIVLVNPLVSCPTGPVYRVFDQIAAGKNLALDSLPDLSMQGALLAFLNDAPNDLEAPAKVFVPQIAGVLTAIANSPSVLLSRMSGSGATCFGLYSSLEQAQLAAVAIKQTLAFAPIWVEADEVN